MTPPGTGPFVAAFNSANLGDVSPNTQGPFCNLEAGIRCNNSHSTCKGKNEGCQGYGPGGKDDFLSTKLIGTNQADKAYELWKSANISITGNIDYRHTYLEFDNITVDKQYNPQGVAGKTCRAAMGDSFAAGTTDGPGAFNFVQGTNGTGNPFWNYVASFIAKPTEEQKKCQAPKPILFDTGGTKPFEWTPHTIPIQIVTIGNFIILAVPAEFTTMSGRRIRDEIHRVLAKIDPKKWQNSMVVIAGLANTYADYITTFEEFQVQRYEGASTIFGPHSLGAYIQEFSKLAVALGKGVPVAPGKAPQDLNDKMLDFNPGVIVDAHPIGKKFGDVKTDVKSSYKQGELVVVEFWGANPRNNYMTESTFLVVEGQDGSDWVKIVYDGSFETKFHWQSHDIAESIITIEWQTSALNRPGVYRIRYFGHSKDILGTVTPFTGTSSTFSLL